MFIHRRSYKGFVVNIQNRSEYDLYVWVFTKEIGLKKFLVKGVKKISSKMIGKFDYMNFLYLESVEKDDEDIAVVVNVSRIYKDNIKWDTKIVYVISELIYKVCPLNQPYFEIYNLIEKLYNNSFENKNVYLVLFFLLNTILNSIGYKFSDYFINKYKTFLKQYNEGNYNDNEIRAFLLDSLKYIYYHTDIYLYSQNNLLD